MNCNLNADRRSFRTALRSLRDSEHTITCPVGPVLLLLVWAVLHWKRLEGALLLLLLLLSRTPFSLQMLHILKGAIHPVTLWRTGNIRDADAADWSFQDYNSHRLQMKHILWKVSWLHIDRKHLKPFLSSWQSGQDWSLECRAINTIPVIFHAV